MVKLVILRWLIIILVVWDLLMTKILQVLLVRVYERMVQVIKVATFLEEVMVRVRLLDMYVQG